MSISTTEEKILISLIMENKFGFDDAPPVCQLNGKWHKMIIGIGSDHTAYLTLDDEALKSLCERKGMDYKLYVNKDCVLATEKTEA